ncbi:hypothetical protein IB223_11500 [Pseudoxanthomonas sp. PXM03]|uniref:hypothetical protein n=1 Tax=Pseudoxanthomonas sp. PXM03 TaxID=2769284 RepID=UPI001783A2A7|nr:hypothetical protein [Pseudoxanthomonas sp. PXM03]MBD9436716.1 hypothetical protein [Pseudoxanthomonas sp. PXM03]
MQVPEFTAELDLAPLLGATIDAYAQDDGYWHLFVALRIVGGVPFVFRTEERSAGPRFDVFPIHGGREADARPAWCELARPFVIERAIPLWRVEWTERGATWPTVGSDPYTHFAGRGPASPQAANRARVLAGVLLHSATGEGIVVAASDSAPFNVDLFLPADAEKGLEGFELPAILKG